MTWTTEEAERVKAIEVGQADHGVQLADINSKLDQLIALKNKGAGVLWVASIIVSAVFTSIIYYVSNLFASHT